MLFISSHAIHNYISPFTLLVDFELCFSLSRHVVFYKFCTIFISKICLFLLSVTFNPLAVPVVQSCQSAGALSNTSTPDLSDLMNVAVRTSNDQINNSTAGLLSVETVVDLQQATSTVSSTTSHMPELNPAYTVMAIQLNGHDES